MRILYIIVLILLIASTAVALEECKRITPSRDIPCRVTSTWNYTPPCTDHSAIVYNSTGGNIINYTFSSFGVSNLCNITFNISQTGSYSFTVSNGDSGNILVEDDEQVIGFGLILFLMAINIVVFLIPFMVKRFHVSEAGDYMVRKLFHIASIIFLWFNMTIFRSMAEDFNLGIDEFLLPLWWFFTLGMFAMVFVMTYIMVIGATKLMKEAKLKRQMGYDE